MEKISTKGINVLKTISVDEKNITGTYNDKQVFCIPNNQILNCNGIRNELVLEFGNNEDVKGDFLTEIRLYVHQQSEENETIEAIDSEIRKHVELDNKQDDFIVLLPDLPFSVPRGKYTADLCRKSIKLHGASYNYNISYTDINKAFLLVMPDKQHVCFVMGFNKPIRQGQTTYKFAIIQFKVDSEIEADLRPDEETLNKINPALQKENRGNYYEVFSRLFKLVSGINITIPSEFKTTKGESAIKCSIGAKQGFLFVLSRSLLFIYKPISHIKFNDITSAKFHRITNAMSNRNFDLEIITKDGQSFMFSDIDKADSELIMNLFSGKKILTSIVKDEEGILQDDYEDDDEGLIESENENNEYGDDDDFVAKDDEEGDEDEDEDFDPEAFKKKKKRKDSEDD